MSLTTILLFLLIIVVLVLIHELGHFLAAKWVGMRVDEFAFGFPPRLFSKKIGETVYAFNALPLGGYVAIWGENGSEDDNKEDGAKHHKRAFGNRPWWAQLFVLVAGVTMNMLLALFIFIIISYGPVNISTTDEIYGDRVRNAQMVIVDTLPNSPALNAGLKPGTVITSMTAGRQKADMTTATSLVLFINRNIDTPFVVTYKTPKGEYASTTIAAVYGVVPHGKKALGIAVDTIGTVDIGFFESFTLGAERTYQMTLMTVYGLRDVLVSLGKGENVLQSLSGPVGIARIVGETSEYGMDPLLTLVAVLSINLAIFNILPLPALDGGRMVMVIIETITRRKIPFKYYSWLNGVGFIALLLLLVVVTFKDFTQ